MPVITTPINAIYFQHLLSSSYETTVEQNIAELEENDNPNRYVEITKDLEFFNPLADFGQLKSDSIYNKVKIVANNYISENYSTEISSSSLNAFTVANQAMEQFPTLAFIHEH